MKKKLLRVLALCSPIFAFCLVLAISLFAAMPVALAADGFEGAAQAFLQALIEKFPLVLTVYLILSAAYNLFCVIAALTKTTKDDKIASFLKAFFSLVPPSKK